MQYRTLGKTGEKVSVLGFGAMRLPIVNNKRDRIDEEKAGAMIRHAISNGINYFDTAYCYHGLDQLSGGNSEPFLGSILAGDYRDKVKIATKLPTWLIDSRQKMDELLDEQLDRLGVEYIDFYLIHALKDSNWKKVLQLGITDFMNKALASGRIKHIGFSFHDSVDVFKSIVDAYNWGFCQIQLNYLDVKYQAGLEGLKYAAAKGLGITIMEPLRGGVLANNLPTDVLKMMHSYDKNKSSADWALEWVFNHEEISVVLSGMTTMKHLSDNLKVANRSEVGAMSVKQHQVIAEIQQIFKNMQQIGCTSCRYCMPCPIGVDIPTNFALYNYAYSLNTLDISKKRYIEIGKKQAGNCLKCKKCMSHCPQNINIIKELEKVKNTLC